MQNPFDKAKQEEKYEFFNQITQAINQWMLEKYPEFDTKLIQKIERLEFMQKAIEERIIHLQTQYSKAAEELIKNVRTRTISQVDDYVKSTYPDLSSKLTADVKSFQKVIQQHEKNVAETEKKLKKIYVSDSLCEDVYAMRDEIKKLKTFAENFNKNLKKLVG